MVILTHTRAHARARTPSRTLAVTECLHDAEMREERKGWKKIRATRSLVNVPCRTVPYLATSYPFASLYRLGYSSSSILFLFCLFREIFRIFCCLCLLSIKLLKLNFPKYIFIIFFERGEILKKKNIDP